MTPHDHYRYTPYALQRLLQTPVLRTFASRLWADGMRHWRK
jgi:hypothetical protein